MWRLLINGILATANALLSNNQNATTDLPATTSTWRRFRNFIFSTIATVGIPLAQSAIENNAGYEYVNTILANSPTARNNIDQRERHNSNLSRHSRPNFRRRSHHNSGNVRIIKPTIHIHIHQP